MKEIKLSQGRFCKNKGSFVALVDDEDFERLNQYRWYAVKQGNNFYAGRHIIVGGKRTVQSMHGAIMNRKWIDHRDMNGLNNQKSNLRFCTNSENQMNKRKQQNCISIYKGVCFYKRDSKWMAYINIIGKRIHLGSFASEIDAARAYNAKATELYGEFANLNIII